MRGAGSAMSDDKQIDIHGLNRLGRVDNGFTFADAAAARRKLDRVGSQSTSRQVKTVTRSGGIFKEDVSAGSTLQQRKLLIALTRLLLEFFRELKDDL